ncbi:LysR substrate-binding domain-containing protein [Reinekea sp.]|jgi:LysR family hydrogen peroxide-inducible transcriptional activator|uniref:hydrogen peroxide-inducible genes activator n=1 Tax=Reinekea sp. TaxID=1970455 RepID=UPI003989758A
MISTKQLYYALAVEKTLHFKRAAEACNISQSALSTALATLEQQLGFNIFERDNKKVLVTPQGKDVLVRAQRIMAELDELEFIAENQQMPLTYPITIGVIPTIAPFLLPKVFPHLNEQYPAAKLNIVEEQSHVLVEMVRRGEIDTAIIAMPYPCDGLLSMEFWQEDFYWVALKGEQFTDQAEVTSYELSSSHLMLLKEGHCLKDHALAACRLPPQSANHGFGATSLNTLVQMVLGRMGTTLIPEMALKSLIAQNSELSAIHLNEPGPHRRLAFIIRPNYTRMRSIEALVTLLKQSLI